MRVGDFPRWRALARCLCGHSFLLWLDATHIAVRLYYVEAFHALEYEEKINVQTIELQRWIGDYGFGHWEIVKLLRVPTFAGQGVAA